MIGLQDEIEVLDKAIGQLLSCVNSSGFIKYGRTSIRIARIFFDWHHCPESRKDRLAVTQEQFDMIMAEFAQRGFLPLAASGGYELLVEGILQKGGNIDQTYGAIPMTALNHAAREGHTEIVRICLIFGANVQYRDAWGKTALEWAQNSLIQINNPSSYLFSHKKENYESIIKMLESAAIYPMTMLFTAPRAVPSTPRLTPQDGHYPQDNFSIG